MESLSSSPSQDENSGHVSGTVLKVLIDGSTCVAALILALTFIIVATQFRLWHSNLLLRKFSQLMYGVVFYLINNTFILVLAAGFNNELYLVWIALLFIAYDGVDTISGYSLLKSSSERMMHELTRLSSIVITGIYIYFASQESEFWHPLIALWALVFLKFVPRIVSFIAAEQAYGMKNTNLIANYMTIEHESSPDNEVDPANMRGYKYIVLGERKIEGKTTETDYIKRYQLPEEVVTVQKVYACKGALLSSFDKDFRLRDICLSFALFKLLKRRFFRYHAAESGLPKTRGLVFRGLLAGDNMERALRVVRTELGFLRDLLYTKYPIIFGRGFPVFSFSLFLGIMGVSLWIAQIAFDYHHTLPRKSTLIVHDKNFDLYLTYVLVLLIVVMEICEVCLYVFSDWSRVMLICKYIHYSQRRRCCTILSKLLDFFFLPILFVRFQFSKPLHNTLGQYSLLKNYNRRSLRWFGDNLLYKLTCGFSATEMGRGLHKDPAIKFPEEVKKVIFHSLQATGEQLANEERSLQNNLPTVIIDNFLWACRLQSHMHTIMVWHIATGLCDIHQTSTQRSGNQEDIASNHKAAISLSRYCAYLALFVPELVLPRRCNAEKDVFEKIVEEAKVFFNGADSHDRMLAKMREAEGNGKGIVVNGARLGRQLTNDLPDGMRWKVLADFWAGLILFLAPSGIASVHAEKLAEGGEFITQLWVLLYHAGINEQVSDPFVDV